jgi:hypothetical protein
MWQNGILLMPATVCALHALTVDANRSRDDRSIAIAGGSNEVGHMAYAGLCVLSVPLLFLNPLLCRRPDLLPCLYIFDLSSARRTLPGKRRGVRMAIRRTEDTEKCQEAVVWCVVYQSRPGAAAVIAWHRRRVALSRLAGRGGADEIDAAHDGNCPGG